MFELYADTNPKTCENFRALCTGMYDNHNFTHKMKAFLDICFTHKMYAFLDICINTNVQKAYILCVKL